MRSEEVEKYTRCYESSSYRMGKRNVARALRDIQSIPKGSTYLDVGCGRGETLRIAQDCGLEASGTEIVPDLCGTGITLTSVTRLPFDSFDYVSCYDVLEHLPAADVGLALDELFRVARAGLFITTNDHKARRGDWVLHLTRKPRTWWESEFRKRGHSKIEHCSFATERDWHWTIVR